MHDNVDDLEMTPVHGPNGWFEIAGCGEFPEEGIRYCYKDEKCCHFFYLHWVSDPITEPTLFSFVVNREFSPDSSVIFSIDADEEERVIRNLEFLFKERSSIPPFDVIKRTEDIPESITFQNLWPDGKKIRTGYKQLRP
jgi:hypothetical protein